jgi:hypothetical protein
LEWALVFIGTAAIISTATNKEAWRLLHYDTEKRRFVITNARDDVSGLRSLAGVIYCLFIAPSPSTMESLPSPQKAAGACGVIM